VDGPAAARTLTAPTTAGRRLVGALPVRARFTFTVASEADDPEVRRMLRETSFPGSVSLSFAREPDSLVAAQVEGDVHDCILARERATGRLAAIASRSSRERFVNGTPTRVGYFGQLRVAAGLGGRRDLLSQGFEFCRSLHQRDTAAMYLASVVAGNTAARRLLERGLPGWPVFRPVDDLVTLAVPRRVRSRAPAVEIVSGDQVGMAEVAAVLTRNNPRYQFAPCWTVEDLMFQPRVCGLHPGDFLVAIRRGAIVGCAALWDQRAFKQVIIRGYSRTLDRCRPLINALGPLFGVPTLPRAGSPLAFAHLSHLAVDDDDPHVAIGLISAGRRAAGNAGLDYITIGVSAASPIHDTVRREFPHRSYASVLYVGFWPDGRPAADALDGRPSHPEMAIL